MDNRRDKLTTLQCFTVAVGALCLTFGLVILFRALTEVQTPNAFVVGVAFLGFGVVRLRSVWHSLVGRS